MAAKVVSKFYCKNPVIVILGCTGTGKSKLAISLAKRFNGEIINADAMQLYKGLDIITNKVTTEEQEGVPHHLLGLYSPLKMLTVAEYKIHALGVMDDIISRKKLPIVVGGTYYYIESLLFDFVLEAQSFYSVNRVDEKAGVSESSNETTWPEKKMKIAEHDDVRSELEKLENSELYERLKEVDPELSKTVHPNYRRKIIRALMVPLQFGEKLSSLLEKQRSQPGSCSSGGPLKMPESLILTLECESDVLKKRLDARVDDMISRGLVDELLEFHNAYNKKNALNNKDPDYTKGIFQSIGFKEFHEFLILSPEARESEEGKKLFDKGVEALKNATRRYARQQTKWLRNRFLKNGKRQLPPIYNLDATDVSKWKENVYDVAEHVVECHLTSTKPNVEPLVPDTTKIEIDRVYDCECGKTLSGKYQWEEHIKGKNHIRQMKKKNRLKTMEEKKLEESEETPTEVAEVT